jgi:hypothetical protein
MSGLSEQAKLAYIQERIKETRSRLLVGLIIIVFGVAFLGIAVVFPFEPIPTWIEGGAGVFLCVFGLVLSLFYYSERNLLLMQLKGMATKTPTCPNCGKPIPQGKYKLCPFCGYALETIRPPTTLTNDA